MDTRDFWRLYTIPALWPVLDLLYPPPRKTAEVISLAEIRAKRGGRVIDCPEGDNAA